MNRFSPLLRRLQAGLCLTVAVSAFGAGLLPAAWAVEPAGEKAAPASSATIKKPAKKELSGAELYAVNCNRCHPERYPTEFTAAQWRTLLLHMRVRANLPAKQARAILKYMQEESGK